MKRVLCALFAALLLVSTLPVYAAAQGEKDLRILFTHDIHSHFLPTSKTVDDALLEQGGAAKLKTLLDANRTDSSVYLDAGDFSMGTLLQAAYTTDAYELRLLGELGCDVTTFGNHEFDYGDGPMAAMLQTALASGDRLPAIVQSNIDLEGDYDGAQRVLRDAMDEYGIKEYTVLDIGGVKAAVFGLFGIDCLSCAPTTGMKFNDYIESAEKTVKKIKASGEADIIICVSHCGTNGDGKTGEDIDLADKVPGIDVIISGHSHTRYDAPITVGKTVIVSCGEYLTNLGLLDLKLTEDGAEVADYRLIPCDGSVPEDAALAQKVEQYKEHINETYLAGTGVQYDTVICRNDIPFISLGEMARTHGEYPMGDLIADSYLYEAEQNGITDVDVALVGLGTIRGSFSPGDITTADAFDICSLGVGEDGSAGHPLLAAYITGKELKLLVELDASLGPMVGSIKMSYAGLRYTFNDKRMLLDRVTDLCLVRPDGTEEEIENGRLYKVCCNMYAANMLGMLNGLTHGILKIVPKFENGTAVKDLYDCSLLTADGAEIKEWAAFKDYLMSFDGADGVAEIPDRYAQPMGRKVRLSEGGLAVLKAPGAATCAIIAVPAAVLILIVALIATRKKRRQRRSARKAVRREKRIGKN